jgi:hypothetical protein
MTQAGRYPFPTTIRSIIAHTDVQYCGSWLRKAAGLAASRRRAPFARLLYFEGKGQRNWEDATKEVAMYGHSDTIIVFIWVDLVGKLQ